LVTHLWAWISNACKPEILADAITLSLRVDQYGLHPERTGKVCKAKQ